MANGIEIILTQKGFFAGRRQKDGSPAPGAHKISEGEIIQMASALMRTYQRVTGQDTLLVPGNDNKMFAMKLVEIKAAGDATPAEGHAPDAVQKAAEEPPKRKRAARRKKAQ